MSRMDMAAQILATGVYHVMSEHALNADFKIYPSEWHDALMIEVPGHRPRPFLTRLEIEDGLYKPIWEARVLKIIDDCGLRYPAHKAGDV